MPVGGRAVITVSFSSLEGGDFNNEAIVRSGSTDSNLTNNQDIDGLTIVPVSDLQLTKSDVPDPVIAGQTITFVDRHNGPSTATNAVVLDDLPAGVVVTSISGSGGATCNSGVPGDAARPASCRFGTIASGASRTMTIVATVKSGTRESSRTTLESRVTVLTRTTQNS